MPYIVDGKQPILMEVDWEDIPAECVALALPYLPVARIQPHLTGGASRLAALLLVRTLPVYFLITPCHMGASQNSVRR